MKGLPPGWRVKRPRQWQALPPAGQSDCDYRPEHDAPFPDMSGAARRRNAAVFMETEAMRMARDHPLLEEGSRAQRKEITKTRIKEARAVSAAWQRVADALQERRARLQAEQARHAAETPRHPA